MLRYYNTIEKKIGHEKGFHLSKILKNADLKKKKKSSNLFGLQFTYPDVKYTTGCPLKA